MKAASFGYVRATSLADVFRLRQETNSRVLAGGQSLLPVMAFRLAEPELLIDITRVPELRGITTTRDGEVRAGALITHAELGRSEVIRRHVPLLTQAVPLIAHPAIRNRGTLGGSLAHADPAAELPACSVALGARIIAAGPNGERAIPAEAFFTGLFATALQPDEIIAAVTFPARGADERSTIVEVARRSGDYAMAGIAACARPGAEPRIVSFGVGDIPVVAHAAGRALGAGPWSPAALAAAQAALDQDLDPPGDQHGGPAMKRHLARVLLARAVARLQQPERIGAV